MENILNTILSHVDDNSLETISQKANTTPTQAKSALSSAIPILMNAMAKNTRTPEGATALQNAIEKDHHASLLDNIKGFFSNPESANGPGILNHVLGEKRQNVVQYISKDSGVPESTASKILEVAAPLVMGFLGKNNPTGAGGISSMLSSFVHAHKLENPDAHGNFNKLLDLDKDEGVMDNLKEMGQSFLGKMMK